MLSIAVASDLHFEFHRDEPGWMPPLPAACDVMVLAGDIGVGQGALDAVFRVAAALPEAYIVWVAGNHEFYRQCIDRQIDRYREACAASSQVFFLENDAVNIAGYRFLGCTLWSGFDCLGTDMSALAMEMARYAIGDFSLIRTGDGSKPFTPQDAMAKFTHSHGWLQAQLALGHGDKTVVVTHFPPSRAARHQAIAEGPLTAYFQADCETLIETFRPALWLYGHNHWSDSLTIGTTRLLSNQLGYPQEGGMIPAFDPENIIELE